MKHVLIALSWYDQPLHEGIVSYAAEHDWQLNTDLIRRMGRLRTQWNGDGIISYGDPQRVLFEKFVSAKCQLVCVQGNAFESRFPNVSSDLDKTVMTAFEFFRRKGFRHFGCYGITNLKRLQRFQALVESNGFQCHALNGESADFVSEITRIRNWLRACRLPMAVYCNNDDQGCRLINIATECGFSVPDDIAVLGTDNSQLACTSCRVHLSSIDTNLHAVGWEAARQLDLLMDGGQLTNWTTLIAPKGIVERASTDTIGATSPHVRQAIAIMEADFDKGISVAEVVEDLDVSQTGLEKAFKRELGYLPKVALRNIRMKVASQLLSETDEKIQTIASRVGMNNPDYFYTAFKRYFGLTPRQYRLRSREK